MTMQEFLKTNRNINLTEIARLMWPGNANAKTYMSKKLSGKRPWTSSDTAKAKEALNEIYDNFSDQYRDLE